MERDLAVFHDVRCRALELVDGDEPLLGQPGLERGVAAVAVHDRMLELVDMVEQVMLLEPRHDGLAALVAVHAGELAVAVHDDGVLVEDVDLVRSCAWPIA